MPELCLIFLFPHTTDQFIPDVCELRLRVFGRRFVIPWFSMLGDDEQGVGAELPDLLTTGNPPAEAS